MAALRHYWICVRSVPGKAWAKFGGISTAATFAVPLALKFLPVNQQMVDGLLIAAVPVTIILCLIIGPFNESFRMYRALEEKSAAREKELINENIDLRVRLAAA